MNEKNFEPLSVRNWTLEILYPTDFPYLKEFTEEVAYLMAGETIAPIAPAVDILLCGFVERDGMVSQINLPVREMRRSSDSDEILVLCSNDVNYFLKEDNMKSVESFFTWQEQYLDFMGEED